MGSAPLQGCEVKDPFAYLNDASLDQLSDVKIPESFDVRHEWLGCGVFNVDQGQCGDCWAASATHTFADRACIHLTVNRTAIPLSRGGAGGVGSSNRLFSAAGHCVGVGSDALAHKHGCQRAIDTLSPQKLISCANPSFTAAPSRHPEIGNYTDGKQLYPGANGCNGGWPENAWRFFFHEGLTTMTTEQSKGCTPYTGGQCSGKDPHNNGCRACVGFDQCADTGLEPELTTVDTFGFIMAEDLPARPSGQTADPRPESEWPAVARQVRNMQIEMLANGPLHVCVDIYTNFQSFFNEHGTGVYNNTDGSPMEGAHCIELVGWGVDRVSGLPYWTFKNSWAHDWAVSGFGRILRGVDFNGIESDVWAGCPSGSNCELTAGVIRYEDAEPGHAAPPTPGETIDAAKRQRHPSRPWNGGGEIEMDRKSFSHESVAPLVVTAVRNAFQDPDMPKDQALKAAKRVWSKNMRGHRVRVEVDGRAGDWSAHRHPHGVVEAV